jgi:hypothetical protein
MLNKIIILGALLMSFARTESQVDSTERIIRSLANKYHTDKLLSYEFTIDQFDSTGKKLVNSTKGKIAKSKTLLHMTYDDVEVILHDSLMLYVVEKKKEMFIKKLTKAQFDTMSGYTIDKYLRGLKSQKIQVKQIRTEADKTLFSMVFNNMPQDLYTFSIDNKTGYIAEIRIDYYTGNEMQIIENRVMNVKYFNYNILNQKNYNPSAKFVRYSNNRYELVETYKNYYLRNM